MNEVVTESPKNKAPRPKYDPDKERLVNELQQAYEKSRLVEVGPLFAAYLISPGHGDAENDLMRYAWNRIKAGAQRKFFHASQSSPKAHFVWKLEAEECAIGATRRLHSQLREGTYKTGLHFSNTIGTIIGHFHDDATRIHAACGDEEVFGSTDEDESEHDTGSAAPMSKSQANTVPDSGRFNFQNPLNHQLLRYLPAEENYLVQTIEDFDWSRKDAAKFLGLKENHLDKHIGKIGETIEQMRLMLLKFRVPENQGEHVRDLAQRFDGFVHHLTGMAKLPDTFTEAVEMATCEATLPCFDRSTKQQVVSHLLKLWRAHTTN